MSGSSSPNGTSAGACARCVGVATTAGVRVLSVGQATGRGEPPLLPDSVETAASAALELVREVLLLRVGVPSRISLNDTSSDMPAEAKRSGVRAGDVELSRVGGAHQRTIPANHHVGVRCVRQRHSNKQRHRQLASRALCLSLSIVQLSFSPALSLSLSPDSC